MSATLKWVDTSDEVMLDLEGNIGCPHCQTNSLLKLTDKSKGKPRYLCLICSQKTVAPILLDGKGRVKKNRIDLRTAEALLGV